jgi:hypothetical protein
MRLQAKFAQLRNLGLRVRPYFDLPVIGQVPLTSIAVPPNVEVDGALVPAGALLPVLQQMIQSLLGGPVPGALFTTSAAAAVTLTAMNGNYVKLTNGGAVVVTLDLAYNIVNAVQNPYIGQALTFKIGTTAATTVAAPTLTDTAVTLAGTTTVTTGGFRDYQAQITQLSTTVGSTVTTGTTFVSLAQVGSTNAFTVTLATNTITPVVGNVIFITVTAGTLPSGWYPVVKVTSATSFIIATPAGTVWTATAATIPGTAVVPSSQFTANLPGVYSPLVTVTGMMGMSAGVMVT